jgi:hypothetical protein
VLHYFASYDPNVAAARAARDGGGALTAAEALTRLEFDVQEVLQFISAGQLLPPLLVVQTLAQSEALTLKIIKRFVAGQLQADEQVERRGGV